MRIRIDLDYIGTAYAGWQVQPGQTTVQGEVERALAEMTGVPTAVCASGRTDAGVHALCQTAHFDTDKPWEPSAFVGGLNVRLPRDIRILRAQAVADDFHARYSAIDKTYEYRLYRSDVDRAVYYGRAARLSPDADIAAMRAAAKHFVGTHDFASFCAANADTKTTVRTVTRADVTERDGLVVYTVTADGFLYNMVRIMAGLLVRLSAGGDPAEVARVLAACDRTAAPDTAPACGLYLKSVRYE